MNNRDQQLADAILKAVEERIRYQLRDDFKEDIKRIIHEHSQESALSFAQVLWTTNDIIEYARESDHEFELTEEQAREFLDENAKYLSTGMIAGGSTAIAKFMPKFMPKFIADIQAARADDMRDRIEDR